MLRLVLRSAHGTRSLRLAAAVATLIAVSFVVGLLAYGQQVVTGAAQATIAAARPEERALVLRGSAGAGGTDLATKDDALRAALAQHDGGPPVDVFVAGYGLGQEFSGPVGTAAGDDHGRVFANVMFLDSLPAHATLLQGRWARPGQAITEATLPRAAAAVLDISVGDRVPVTDRRTEQTRDVLVTGIWEAVDPTDPYWLLAPGHDIGVRPGSHSYGPLILDRADFLRSWADGASVAWVVRPDLTGAGLSELIRVREYFGRLGEGGGHGVPSAADADLLTQVGLANGGQVSTSIDELADRLARADLVGRSAQLTPVLLVTVLAGCALLLIALLLTEHRRGQTQLIRARGGSRPQLARLAGLEAAMLVLPAIVAAPPVSDAVLRWVGLDSSSGAWRWVVAGGFGLACAAVLVTPSIRRSGTYVDELVTRSRPRRFAAAQRAGVDLAVVALAVLAWLQLRQYASPLSGSGEALGVDPLLASAPVLGVLAGTLLCLRLLPRATDLAERAVDRRHWPAIVFALWQAGRRPQAGRVLLVALAVATSTLAWSLLGTAQRSLVDQADFAVGADLRLVETAAVAPEGRTAQVAALPGVAAAVPVSRMVLTLGPEYTRTTLIGIDAARAGEVMRSRDDLGLGPAVFADLAAPRPELPLLPLPSGATRLAATMAAALGPSELDDLFPASPLDLTATAILLAPDGHVVRLTLGTVGTAQDARRFEVALPGDPGLALVQISVEVAGPTRSAPVHWSLTDVEVADASGAWSPLDLTRTGGWVLVDVLGEAKANVVARAASLEATREPNIEEDLSMNFAVMPVWTRDTVPVVATPLLLRTLGVEVGEVAPVTVAGTPVKLLVVGEVAAVPGTSRSPSAALADLPSLAVAVARLPDHVVAVTEHWVATEPGAVATTAQAAGELPGIRVLDRVRAAEAAGRDPYGVGGRTALVVAGIGAFLLALIGVAVDVRASAGRRVGEFAVLQAMGAGSRLLARTVLGEQGLLAGLGVLVGLGIGLGVAATLAPLVILTPSADRPEPPALLSVPWLPVLGTAGGLLAAAMILSGVVAATLGRRLAVARLRVGDEA
ncbi:MAG: ABC transporter permease [Micromonosporaceae bacterium]|nr:ABC transporter permease [Micromonosporaceae bacterium]